MEPHCALDVVKKSLVYMPNKYHQQNQNSFLFPPAAGLSISVRLEKIGKELDLRQHYLSEW